MSDKITAAVKAFLYKQPGRPVNPDTESIHTQELLRGARAKRVLDKQRTSQNYYRTKRIQDPLLNHYENVDWYERDSSFDFAPFIEKS